MYIDALAESLHRERERERERESGRAWHERRLNIPSIHSERCFINICKLKINIDVKLVHMSRGVRKLVFRWISTNLQSRWLLDPKFQASS